MPNFDNDKPIVINVSKNTINETSSKPGLKPLKFKKSIPYIFKRSKNKGLIDFYDFGWVKNETGTFVTRDLNVPYTTPGLAATYLNQVLVDFIRSLWTTKYKHITGSLLSKVKLSVSLNDQPPVSVNTSNINSLTSDITEPITILDVYNYDTDSISGTTYIDDTHGTPLLQHVRFSNENTSYKITGGAFTDVIIPFSVNSNDKINVFINPAVIQISASDNTISELGGTIAGAFTNLAYPAYRWIFSLFGGCPSQPTGATACVAPASETNVFTTPRIISNLRVWDREIVTGTHFLESFNLTSLRVKSIEVITSFMGELKYVETNTSVITGYVFDRQDHSGTSGQVLCGDLSSYVGTNTSTSVNTLNSSHSNTYMNMGGSEIQVPETLVAVLNQGSNWYYLWRL